MKIISTYEAKFWKKVYVAAIRAGRISSEAKALAEQAIAHCRETYSAPRRSSVFVPFEVFPDKTEKRCNDLPRFGTSQGVWNFLQTNGQLLAHRKLEWREHTDKQSIEEYRAGFGTLRILL